jgi:hypothetical protein
VAEFHPEIVRVNLGAELDLLDLVCVLMFSGLLLLFGLLIAKLAEIHQTTDGGNGRGCNFDKVNAFGTREIDGVGQGNNAELLAVGPDDADFTGTNFPVYPE